MRFFFFLTLFIQFSFSQSVYKKSLVLMGVDFEFSVVAKSQKKADGFINKAIKTTKAVEELISSWKPNSQTSLINKNSGVKPVKVDKELFDLIKRSKRISQLTNGIYDISYASLDKLWYFDKPMLKFPDSTSVRNSVAKINYKAILLNELNQTVFLRDKGMKIGFGSIGKGYVAEKVKKELIKLGVSGGLINAGGDLTTWGNHPITKHWVINIAHPDNIFASAGEFNLHNNSVVTSGNYAKYIDYKGDKYSHIINPKTGYPVRGLKSVTVFCKNTELADALSTAVFILGKEKGLQLINKLQDIECLLIDDSNRFYYSDKLEIKN